MVLSDGMCAGHGSTLENPEAKTSTVWWERNGGLWDNLWRNEDLPSLQRGLSDEFTSFLLYYCMLYVYPYLSSFLILTARILGLKMKSFIFIMLYWCCFRMDQQWQKCFIDRKTILRLCSGFWTEIIQVMDTDSAGNCYLRLPFDRRM